MKNEQYAWLINLLEKFGELTFSDIASYWEKAPCNTAKTVLQDRTFRNWRKKIEADFGVTIECRSAKYYHIIRKDKTTFNEIVHNRMLESIALNEAVTKCSDLESRIFIDETPSCHEYLLQILNAMRENKVMAMSYGNRTSAEYIDTFRFAPLAIKEHQRRMYVLVKYIDEAPSPKENYWSRRYGKLRLYAIDKIATLDTLDATFEYPKDFLPFECFFGSYGATFEWEMYNVPIKIRVPKDKCEILDKFPLHMSQQKLDVDDKFGYYQYAVLPSREFGYDLLKVSPKIQVLEPKSMMYVMEDISTEISEYQEPKTSDYIKEQKALDFWDEEMEELHRLHISQGRA